MREELSRLLGLLGSSRNSSGPAEWTGGQVLEIPVDAVKSGRYQAREVFDEEGLKELAESIAAHGVIQPILVAKSGDGYELIAGERRLIASRMAGKTSIPAIVRELTPKEMAVIGLIENVQRRDLSFIEEAQAYQRLMDEFELTQEEVARLVGKSQSTVANKLRVLKLPQEVLEGIAEGGISERHARALLKLDDANAQLKVIREVKEKNLTVAQTEELVEKLGKGGKAGSRGGRQQGRSGKHVVKVVKDIRLFLNGIKQVVGELRQVGVPVEVQQEDGEEWIELRIRISKRKSGGKKKERAGGRG